MAFDQELENSDFVRSQIVISAFGWSNLAEQFDHAARDFRRAAITIAKRSANAIAGMPYLLYGTRSSIKALLRDRRERFGLNYISVPGQAMDEFAPIVQELRGT